MNSSSLHYFNIKVIGKSNKGSNIKVIRISNNGSNIKVKGNNIINYCTSSAAMQTEDVRALSCMWVI